jgi:hypothetical protein
MTVFKIGQTLERVAPTGDVNIVTITRTEHIAYHQDLESRGYKYRDLEPVGDTSFELPEVGSGKAAAPRVHVGGSTCTSCEG